MAAVSNIDSDRTSLRIAEELGGSIGSLSGSEVWNPFAPNSYGDFGGTVTTVPRNPINPSRQRRKGVVTDVDAMATFSLDLTQEDKLFDLLQGFFFADIRSKSELTGVAVVDGTGNDFEPASGGTGYVANDLLFAKGADDDANNGLHVVTGVPTATSIPVASSLVTAAAQSITLRRVGFQFAAGDAEIDASGTYPRLTTSTKDCTTLGIIPGEWVFLGDDSVATYDFVTAANNGFKRVRRVATNYIEFDKSVATMVTETDGGAALTVRIFLGRVLKNESDPTLITRRTYNLERQLGAPDDALPAQIQAEYVNGAVPNELTINLPTADKVTMDMTFMALTTSRVDGPTALRAGTRPAVADAAAFNASTDVSGTRLAVFSSGVEAPTPLWAYVKDVTLTLSNNLSRNQAVGVTGAFDLTTGQFQVGGSMTAYLQGVAAIDAVINNSDVTFHKHFVKENGGMTFDLPLVTLGNGKANVAQNQAVELPLDIDANSGIKLDPLMDHTLLMMIWDYLPDAADL